ncbi:MAG TPA: phosphopantothenoylcysteine decarboxylase, partial [Gemmatimonadaceae bacterium]|nr:phosphopantothenoylcysteine decarboxylase [Gemmatimonadaceae bacterium]
SDRALAGRRIVVTAGPTREAVDPVRYVSNRSSGKMGVAIAEAAWRRGADVLLIAGPLSVPVPVGVRAVHVETTEEMAHAVRASLADADALIMAAAPADFRAAEVAEHKIKKGTGVNAITLAPTTDILADTRDARRAGMITVGFALETRDALAAGRGKLTAKGLDMVVVNDATEEGAGFSVDTNRVSIVHADGGEEHLALMPKSEVADAILDRVAARMADGR